MIVDWRRNTGMYLSMMVVFKTLNTTHITTTTIAKRERWRIGSSYKTLKYEKNKNKTWKEEGRKGSRGKKMTIISLVIHKGITHTHTTKNNNNRMKKNEEVWGDKEQQQLRYV